MSSIGGVGGISSTTDISQISNISTVIFVVMLMYKQTQDEIVRFEAQEMQDVNELMAKTTEYMQELRALEKGEPVPDYIVKWAETNNINLGYEEYQVDSNGNILKDEAGNPLKATDDENETTAYYFPAEVEKDPTDAADKDGAVDALKDFNDIQGGIAQVVMLRLQNANNNANNAVTTITNWMSRDYSTLSGIIGNLR